MAAEPPIPDGNSYVRGDDGIEICVVRGADAGRRKANAALIAAAPGLLAVAECEAASRMPNEQGLAVFERHGLSNDYPMRSSEFLALICDRSIAKAYSQTIACGAVGATAAPSNDPTLVAWTVHDVMAELTPHIDALAPGQSFDVLAQYRNESPMFWALVPAAIGRLFSHWQPIVGRDERLRYTVDTSVCRGLPYCDVTCNMPGLGGGLVRRVSP